MPHSQPINQVVSYFNLNVKDYVQQFSIWTERPAEGALAHTWGFKLTAAIVEKYYICNQYGLEKLIYLTIKKKGWKHNDQF